jgi:hypothetical protein
VESTFAAGKALNNNPGIFVHQYAHLSIML